jgi:hypothetical protein
MRLGELWCAVAATSLLVVSTGQVAAAEAKAVAALRVNGECTDALHGGRMPRYHGCGSAVAEIELSDGLRGLAFTNGTSMFMFVGTGTRWNQKTAGRLNVVALATGWGKKLEVIPGKGYCRFGNLYSGQEVSISCSATMKNGHWSGAFKTDGKPPFAVKVTN